MTNLMTKEDIAEVLAEHLKWLRGEGGKRANMRGAYMQGAYMQGANMQGADMRGAYMQGANMQGAYMQGAKIDNGNIVIGIMRRATRADGYEFFLWHCQEGFYVKAGCHFFTVAEARQHWTVTRAGTPLGNESLDILDFFDAAIHWPRYCKRQEAAQ